MGLIKDLKAKGYSIKIVCPIDNFSKELTNSGLDPLIVIEVQSGDYLGEDDIVRFDDKYGRII